MPKPRYIPSLRYSPRCCHRIHLYAPLRLFIPRVAAHHFLSSVLASTEHEIGIMPGTLEADSRMKDSKTSTGDDDHDTFENHERHFFIGEQFTVETA